MVGWFLARIRAARHRHSVQRMNAPVRKVPGYLPVTHGLPAITRPLPPPPMRPPKPEIIKV